MSVQSFPVKNQSECENCIRFLVFGYSLNGNGNFERPGYTDQRKLRLRAMTFNSSLANPTNPST